MVNIQAGSVRATNTTPATPPTIAQIFQLKVRDKNASKMPLNIGHQIGKMQMEI